MMINDGIVRLLCGASPFQQELRREPFVFVDSMGSLRTYLRAYNSRCFCISEKIIN